MTITRDEKTGLISEDSFPDIATEKWNALRAQGEDADFTLVKVPELNEFTQRLGKVLGNDLVSQISAQLKQHSADGDSAAKIKDSKFFLKYFIADVARPAFNFQRFPECEDRP